MSSCRKNQSKQLDLEQICQFLKLIGAMTASLLILSLIGFLFSSRQPETDVIYVIIITLNILVLIISLVIPTYLLKQKITKSNEVVRGDKNVH